MDDGKLFAPVADATGPGLSAAVPVSMVFDVSDLIEYFIHSRLPTGIQRVQIEVARNLLADPRSDIEIGFVSFVRAMQGWAEIAPADLMALADLAMRQGDAQAPEWREAFEAFHGRLQEAPPFAFPAGAWLVNLGSSWGIPNYFLHLRKAKVLHGLRYVPFIHDCIPLTAQEYCAPQQTREFLDWILGVFQHADRIIVNSRASARDLRRVAAALGQSLDMPPVVTLDADFRTAETRVQPAPLREDLASGNFVLMVSTIEARKNHLAVFAAWLALLRRHGPARVPMLVCIGKPGWESGPIYARLASNDLLRRRAMILSDVTDAELAALYRHCRFTLYPSFYEGWGLPVTEALCHGRVPLVARTSSLPEAGGEFARYFDLGSQASLEQALESLIFDDAARAGMEARIAAAFRARRWSDIAADITGLVRDWARSAPAAPGWHRDLAARGLWPCDMPLGIWLGLSPCRETELWPGRSAPEALRQGENWWDLEDWGCWTRGKLARLAALVRLPDEGSAIVHIGLLGLSRGECRGRVTLQGIGQQEVTVGPSSHAWVSFEVTQERAAALRLPDGRAVIDIVIASDRSLDFAEVTGGADRRTAGLGVRGILICAAADTGTRLRFLECATLGNFRPLLGMPDDIEHQGVGRWADADLPDPGEAAAT
ncbi:glycosyltransferase family 4 protein [Paracraurococcus lichenis]|uniref:Glycosyltransferase family 1 protein n=1 Tax=Paracraurococcus lichenis TaxID=3064888 RepID=A0ABT9E2W1_9PROT|nr:glycosyltransferase family 1 protein [Paracraurococcus sp. LOR1-02]MDO9710500.1 glycosyltransferase family 1 protein [Paracraurococcus sp. LOR1-02]